MKNFSKYLRYSLKKSTVRSIIITSLALILVMIMLPEYTELHETKVPAQAPDTSTEDARYTYEYTDEYIYIYTNEYCTTGLNLLSVILGIISTLMPILSLSELKERRNLDTLYSLPISRLKLYIVHFVSGFIQVLFIHTCTFLASYLFLRLTTDFFDLSYMLLYYPSSILAGLAIYCFFAFFFTVANTVIDGVVISGLWVLTPYMIFGFLNHIDVISGKISNVWGNIYSPLDNLTTFFSTRAEIYRKSTPGQYKNIVDTCYMFIIWAAVALLCAIGFIILSSKHRTNKAGEISDSIFGYKLLIPLSGILLDPYGENLILVAVAIFIMYIVYRRSFKLKKQDYIVMGAVFIINLLNTY